MRKLGVGFFGAFLLLVACSSGQRGGIVDPGTPSDDPSDDGGLPLPGDDGGGNLPPVNECAPSCGPEDLCGELGDGTGLDEDCDDQVDEGCRCVADTVRPCFAGPPDRQNIGACTDGLMTCDELRSWGPCLHGVSPSGETCDGVDNDCNAITDDLEGCDAPVTCPTNGHAAPLSTYALRGDSVYAGAGTDWHWRIECPSSVPAELCPEPVNPNAEDTEVYFTASGAYRVSLDLTLEDGSDFGCAWTIYVAGSGLRVEVNWDTMQDTRGGTDVDLHLHRWTRNGTDTNWFGPDDCFYGNCTPRAAPGSIWGEPVNWTDHPSSDLENCEDAPHGGGALWQSQGSCRNPRLDVDTNGIDGACRASVTDPNNTAFCAPENIIVDPPVPGMPYRILVNHFAGEVTARPTVNIYCGGALRSTLEAPMALDGDVGLLGGPTNDNWVVADVVFVDGVCGSDCQITPINTITRAPMPAGFDDPVLSFGPAWSCTYDAATHTCE